MISRKTLATGHTWNEANYKTPIDRGLDESHFRKLFLRRNVVMSRERDEQPTKNTEPLTVEESKEYDYNNENDASYCPNHVSDADDWCNEEGLAAGELHDQAKSAELEEIGDMLEPPTKVAKIFIPYAMRAKKVDMKLLKHCTWRMLTEKTADGHKEDVAPTTFSAIYSRLPEKLSTNMRESLSVPLALLSVLHLANEKGLILEKRDDLKDFDVVGLIKT
uniref:Condensin complex subunit 2 n=3 Tax=Pararge aegeria TaxID=116150 RepID=S4NRW7_9NEOP